MKTYREFFVDQQKSPQDLPFCYRQKTSDLWAVVNYAENGGKIFSAFYVRSDGRFGCVNNMGFSCVTQDYNTNALPCCTHITGMLKYEFEKNPQQLVEFFNVAVDNLSWANYQEKLRKEKTFKLSDERIPGLFEKSNNNLKMVCLPPKRSSSLVFSEEIIRVVPE